MKEYLVYFMHPEYGVWVYAVNADDEDHAKEQVLDAEPKATELHARLAASQPIRGEDDETGHIR